MQHNYTVTEIHDMIKSMCDPLHFMSNHVKVGLENMLISEEMKDWAYSATNWTVAELGEERASGRSIFMTAYILWYASFHADKTVLVVAPNSAMLKDARERFSRMHNCLPDWLRSKTFENNRQTVHFENGARIHFHVASRNVGRGFTINLLALDEWDSFGEQVKDDMFHNLVPALHAPQTQVLTTGSDTEWGVYNKPLLVPLTKVLD